MNFFKKYLLLEQQEDLASGSSAHVRDRHAGRRPNERRQAPPQILPSGVTIGMGPMDGHSYGRDELPPRRRSSRPAPAVRTGSRPRRQNRSTIQSWILPLFRVSGFGSVLKLSGSWYRLFLALLRSLVKRPKFRESPVHRMSAHARS